MNRVSIKAVVSAAIFMFVGSAVAYAQSTNNNGNLGSNPPFVSKLNVDIVKPIPVFNAVSANAKQYENVAVYSPSGKLVNLDARRQPILFEAYWCPHCQRTIVMLNKHRSQLSSFPILVSFGFQPNTSLHQAIKLTSTELKALNIKNVKVYYVLQYHIRSYAPNGIPELVFSHSDKLESLSGEHTLQIWKMALESR